MEEFFRFWRRIPRFLFGLATVLVITASVLGKQRTIAFFSYPPPWSLKDIGDVTSSLLIGFVLLSIGSFGVFLLEVLALGAEGAIHWLAARGWVTGIVDRSGLHSALSPIPVLALEYYQKRKDLVLEFLRLRSRATPGHDLDPEQLKDFYTEVGNHIDAIRDPSFLWGFGYMTRLTQDQVKLENKLVEIREIYYFIFFVAALLLLALRFDGGAWVVVALMVTLMASIGLAVPMVRDRKQELAISVVFGYCDNFSVAEGATIEDRAEV